MFQILFDNTLELCTVRVFLASSDKERDASLTKRSRFTGTVYDLPEDSRRPQIAEGRTFPLKVRGEYLPYESVRGAEKVLVISFKIFQFVLKSISFEFFVEFLLPFDWPLFFQSSILFLAG